MSEDGAVATLRRVANTWRPERETVREPITALPSAALAGVFDQPSPVAADGDPLPPLWHWLHFLDRPAQAELGEDGHPAHGTLLPDYPRRRRMFAGGRLTVHAPLRVGAEVTRTAQVTGVRYTEGRSGPMLFVTSEYRFTDGDTLLCVEEQDIVYRQDPATPPEPKPDAKPDAKPAEPDGPAPDWTWSLTPGPALLFRFSALTYNSHRIHYDQPYVTAVEGFPGLVVHGPLTALALLELPRRAGAPVRTFAFRARRPMFAGERITYEGHRDGDHATLAARTATTPKAVTAEIELG
ncbi:MAG TPA: MaoC family dehydratase N-terminal domain-containing protein [Streptosporangiaceae bacterium]|jgi:3-methylfumaryl-CoA hydratase